jgi:hypothetical protein
MPVVPAAAVPSTVGSVVDGRPGRWLGFATGGGDGLPVPDSERRAEANDVAVGVDHHTFALAPRRVLG